MNPHVQKNKRFFFTLCSFVCVCAFSLPGNLCGRLDNNHVTGFRQTRINQNHIAKGENLCDKPRKIIIQKIV